ncbi:MAG: hypothetical protein HND48_22445 [Chloroflexi bacterium]|nr:hypothetical protein [Chloroflexota bacterium]
MMYADGMMETRAMAAPTPTVEQREFFEYQLYEVARRVTLGANETKQVEFIAKTGVPASTFFVYDGSSPFYGYSSPIYDQGYGITGVTTVGTYLSFTTAEDGGLGADLPAGRVRVYQLGYGRRGAVDRREHRQPYAAGRGRRACIWATRSIWSASTSRPATTSFHP